MSLGTPGNKGEGRGGRIGSKYEERGRKALNQFCESLEDSRHAYFSNIENAQARLPLPSSFHLSSCPFYAVEDEKHLKISGGHSGQGRWQCS